MKAIIVAAGESSRFWPLNRSHKTLLKIMGRPVIFYTIEGLRKAGLEDIIIIQGPGKEIEKELGNQEKIKYIVQQKPAGMGDAIMLAEKFIGNDFMVINAERFDSLEYAEKIIEKKKSAKSDIIMLASRTKQPWLFGILKIASGSPVGIVEKPKPGQEPSNIKAAGMYMLPKEFFSYHRKTSQSHYSFEATLDRMMKEFRTSLVLVSEPLSLKYPWHLFSFFSSMSSKIKRSLGNAKISRNAVLEGPVFLGKNVRIMENAVIKGPAYIGDNCMIGNNALVRQCDLEANSIVGANCEIARSIVQENTHLHSGFVGDSLIGKNCRLGAGLITANVRADKKEVTAVVKGKKIPTGMKSLGTVIGDNTKIGIAARTMPGIFIGYDCIIGPSSTVMKNVESGHRFYSKFHMNVKKKVLKTLKTKL